MSDQLKNSLDGEREEFHKAVDFGFRVSLNLNGKPATEQSELASIIHTKMCINGASIEHMLDARLADHSAIISLCRMMMEAAPFYCYLMEPVDRSEWICRKLCARLHDTTNRIMLMRGFQSENEYADLLRGKEELCAELKENAFFKTLAPERAKILLTGQHFYVRGARAAAKAMGWSERKWIALYSYFSSHSHTAPMSFFRTKQHKVSFSDPSDAQRAAVMTALGVAEFSLLKTTIAHLDADPDARSAFSESELDAHNKSIEIGKKQFESDD